MAECGECKGSKVCGVCKGRGYTNPIGVARDCRTCANTGKCPRCKGTGTR